MFSLIRLTRLIFRSRTAMIIVGIIVVIIGLVYGLTSKQVNYIQSDDNATYHLGTGQQSGNLYINADGSSDYFVAFSSDFTVPQSELDTPGSVSFIARSDTSTLDPPLNASDGSTITEAHKIEKLVLKDNNGATLGTFTTPEYDANPNGVYVNNWPFGLVILVIGLVLFGLSFAIHRPKQLPGFAVAGQPPVYGQPNANPYGQPMANPYAQGQPNANPYGQPAPNPYGQPYQGPPPAGQPYNPYPPNPSNPQYPQQ